MRITRLLPRFAIASAMAGVVVANGIAPDDEDDKGSNKSNGAAQAVEKSSVAFTDPVRLMFDGKPIQVSAPGYASPCFADIDQDGKRELLVGQFSGGKIRVFRGFDANKFESSEWLKASGKVAEVPGVW
ncbi:MAG: hypothetical protein AB8G99_25210 [Planctomycetaceae bacterium]